jgi:hypothetical protein
MIQRLDCDLRLIVRSFLLIFPKLIKLIRGFDVPSTTSMVCTAGFFASPFIVWYSVVSGGINPFAVSIHARPVVASPFIAYTVSSTGIRYVALANRTLDYGPLRVRTRMCIHTYRSGVFACVIMRVTRWRCGVFSSVTRSGWSRNGQSTARSSPACHSPQQGRIRLGITFSKE